MKHFICLICGIACLFPAAMAQQTQLLTHWESRSPMPVKRSNMATASLQIGDTVWIYTFMGIDSTKACGTGIMLDAHKYNTVTDTWQPIAPVPDSEGRLAASATGVNGKVYLIGGYKVFGNCNEFSSPRVDIYDPATNTWSLGDSVPTPTDDHVQLLHRDSLIILLSGWSNTTNIRKVQVYDTYLDTWYDANDLSGPGLFGHCGGISGDTIVYLDGVRITGFSFILVNAVWKGVIQNGDPHNIAWTAMGAHPGDKVYRGGGFQYQDRVLFTGGSNNAYNFDGIGYNTQPSVESGRTFGYNLTSGLYEDYARNPDSVMDVREVVQVGANHFYVTGGMSANQEVTNKVSVFVVDTVITSNFEARPPEPALRLGPNPTSGPMSLNINLYMDSEVEIQLYDAWGREAQTVQREEELPPGSYNYLLDLRGMEAGVYILKARLGHWVKTQKVVVN